MEKQQIQVIINPAAGTEAPILNTLHRVFSELGVAWEAAITQEAGHGTGLAQQAVAAGADLVAVWGGDGTIMEVVNGLAGSGIPLAILPGGTGNSLSLELGIPRNLEQAAALIGQPAGIRRLDLGEINGRYFLLHAHVGLQPAQEPDREMKQRFGALTYVITLLKVMTDPSPAHYRLTIDGQAIERDGVLCFVINAAGLGVDLPLTADIRPDDGLLNVLLVNRDAGSLLAGWLEGNRDNPLWQQWTGREITVQADPPQQVWLDGERSGETPLRAVVRPGAIGILVPQ